MDALSLVPLQAKDQKVLMDIIDKLRSEGMSRYVNLPQIVDCSDQFSGKSSVLQAISRMSFPASDSLCTRFATELTLRRAGEHSGETCRVNIQPGSDRSDDARRRLEAFLISESSDQRNIGPLIDEAAKKVWPACREYCIENRIMKAVNGRIHCSLCWGKQVCEEPISCTA